MPQKWKKYSHLVTLVPLQSKRIFSDSILKSDESDSAKTFRTESVIKIQMGLKLILLFKVSSWGKAFSVLHSSPRKKLAKVLSKKNSWIYNQSTKRSASNLTCFKIFFFYWVQHLLKAGVNLCWWFWCLGSRSNGGSIRAWRGLSQ